MSRVNEVIHASAVCIGEAGVLMTGPSGRGKSSLALQLIALGADLVADDQVLLSPDDRTLYLSKPETLPAKIEARGVGLLDAPMRARACLSLMIDLDTTETERMPHVRQKVFMGIPVTIWRYVDAPYFPSAILLYLREEAKKLG